MKRDLEHYLRLRYPIELVEAEEGGYFARIPDLPGCIAQGETIDETLNNLEGAKRAWIEVRLEDGLEIPPPHEVVDEYSGRFLLRVPKSLHRELATRAREEGTSLNQYVLHLVSIGLGLQRSGVQLFAIEKLIGPEVLLQFLKRTQELSHHYVTLWRTSQQAHPLDLLVHDLWREEGEQSAYVQFRNRPWVSWRRPQQEEMRTKEEEPLFGAGLARKGYPTPKV